MARSAVVTWAARPPGVSAATGGPGIAVDVVDVGVDVVDGASTAVLKGAAVVLGAGRRAVWDAPPQPAVTAPNTTAARMLSPRSNPYRFCFGSFFIARWTMRACWLSAALAQGSFPASSSSAWSFR